jgi:hypothetical protein
MSYFLPTDFFFICKSQNRTLSTSLRSPKILSLELIHENFFLRPLDFQKYHIEVLELQCCFRVLELEDPQYIYENLGLFHVQFIEFERLLTYMKFKDFTHSNL